MNRVKILAQLERTGSKDKIESIPRDPKKTWPEVEGQERNIFSSMLSAPFLRLKPEFK